MSLMKLELEQWQLAARAFDEKKYETALELFESVGESAKIFFNIGVILSTLNEHESAVRAYISALQQDQYFAVAYFQKGVSNMILKDFEAAFEDFNDALLYLRGNLYIDYAQLGLEFKLYSCEVLFNRALCYFYLGEDALGMNDLLAAQKEKQTPKHSIIDKAIDNKAQDCPFFSIPRGALYRPCESKIKNSKKVDYLGNSKLIAAADDKDTFTGFKGALVRKATHMATTSPVPSVKSGFGKPMAEAITLREFKSNPYANNQFTRAALAANEEADNNYIPDMILPSNHPANNAPNLAPNLAPKPSLVRRATLGDSLRRTNSRAAERFRAKPNLVRHNTAAGYGKFGNDHEVPKLDINAALASMPRTHSPLATHAPSNPLNGYEKGDIPALSPLSTSPTSSLGSAEDTSSLFSSSRSVRVPKGKLKVKCHHTDTRVILVDYNVTFDGLLNRIKEKFGIDGSVKLKYRDEDDELVLITDQDDLDLARGLLDDDADSGLSDRLEVWCFV
ncbi:hypothetical protein K493DRAFT_341641 [Basidiobolus meristosporus CBS 931.73]|uniref:PB1 domain-containing protein n=1 Tax=Basidiobolus meristosporus CBS 931.73 TaxID=1314790 RepID=A0A1Y1XKU7_9FUNG|nr:hypothetical protein K493DRAFT_341641 [Basidiobolus meristosporus CBS 931.73]|eukprot:ORX86389.1 hypothetical protein K493DRAFT_341641 [Basidiobolus meristosporus CBS 931.73]